MAITWPLLFLKPFQALVGRMTHQSVLSDFIPLRRKGDVGKHWHLEMTAFFTDHYPDCPLYSSQWEATDFEANCFFIVCRSKGCSKGWFFTEGTLAGHTDAKKWILQISMLSAIVWKISVWYISDSEVDKAV